MKAAVLCVFVLVLLCDVDAFWNRMLRRLRPRSDFPPDCQTWMSAIKQQMREDRRNGEAQMCQDLDFAMCRYQDMLNARNKIQEEPSQDCIDQINDLIDGTSNTTTTTTLSSTS